MISHNPIYACRLRTYSCVVKNSIKNIIVINANLLISMRELHYVSRPVKVIGIPDSGKLRNLAMFIYLIFMFQF